ncbi:MAG: hypothetical protein Q9180_004602, partial [Flavoplaca navasiana]
ILSQSEEVSRFQISLNVLEQRARFAAVLRLGEYSKIMVMSSFGNAESDGRAMMRWDEVTMWKLWVFDG